MKLRVVLALVAFAVVAGPHAADSAAAMPQPILGQKKAKAKKKARKGKRGELQSQIRLIPRGVEFGQSLDEISKRYADRFDRYYRPQYRKAQPGVQMRELDAEVADRKRLIARNHIKFGTFPTGVDNTPLRGEYAYRNNESMTRIRQIRGNERFYFFFEGRLWKVYDEHTVGAGGPLGSGFDAAVEMLTEKFKAKPIMHEADPAKGRDHNEAWWMNDDMVIRLLDRGDKLAMVYADRKVFDSIGESRKNSAAEDESQVSADVQGVLRTSGGETKKQKGKAKKGKK